MGGALKKESILALDEYHHLYTKLTNFLDFTKRKYSKTICDGDIIYDTYRSENSFLEEVYKVYYPSSWVFSKLRELGKPNTKIGSSFVRQELTLKYNSVCNQRVDDRSLKFLRINPSKEVKVFQHLIDKNRQIY